MYKHLNLHPKVQIIQTLPGGLIAVCKPCGLLSHPNPVTSTSLKDPKPSQKQDQKHAKSQKPNHPQALIKGIYNHKQEYFQTTFEKEIHKTHLIHRLDKGTSGILLLSTEQETAQTLRKLWRQRMISKEYYAIVHGIRVLDGKREIWWENKYEKEIKDEVNIRAKSAAENSSIAITQAIIEQENVEKRLTLLRLQPMTGFTHQLRFQCALHRCPIVGDDIYGDFTYTKLHKIKRMYLHAHSVKGEYIVRYATSSDNSNGANDTFEKKEEQISFHCTAPLPAEFLKLIE